MISCFQCRSKIDSSVSRNGMFAKCPTCSKVHISLGRLVTISDGSLIVAMWEFVESSSTWKVGPSCGRCETPMREIPFTRDKKSAHLHACMKCYLIALDVPTLEDFKSTHYNSVQTSNSPSFSLLLYQEIKYLVIIIYSLLNRIVTTLIWLLTDTPLSRYKGTFILAFISVFFGVFSILMPYTVSNLYGFVPMGHRHGLEGSVIFSSLLHISTTHLITSLYFLIQFGGRSEKHLGTSTFLGLTFLCTWISLSLGSVLIPYESAPTLGLGVAIASMMGFQLAFRPYEKIKLLPGANSPKRSIFFYISCFLLLEGFATLSSVAVPSRSTITYSLISLAISFAATRIFYQRFNNLDSVISVRTSKVPEYRPHFSAATIRGSLHNVPSKKRVS